MLRGDQSRYRNLNWGRINAELQKMGLDYLLPSVSGSFGKEASPAIRTCSLSCFPTSKLKYSCCTQARDVCRRWWEPVPTPRVLHWALRAFPPTLATLWAPGQPSPAFQGQEQFPNLNCFPCRAPLPLSGFRKFPWVFWEAHLQKTPETQQCWFGDKWLLKIVHLFTVLKHSSPSCWCSSWKYWC